MKRIALISNLMLLTATGCTLNQSRDRAYQINSSYSYISNGKTIVNEFYIEKQESRFRWSVIDSGENQHAFYFVFSYNDTILNNSDEFEYMTSTNEIVEFRTINDSGNSRYIFNGAITIYIYYDAASLKTRKIIESNTYNLEIGNVKWFSEPSLFDSQSVYNH